MKRLAVAIWFLGSTLLVPAQTASSPSVIKDATAVTLAQKSLSAMGGSNLPAYQDITASGSVTFAPGSNGTAATYPLILDAKGTIKIRSEMSKPNGPQVWATDGNSGCMTYGEVSRPVAFENLLAQRADFFPVLSLLSEHSNSNISVQNAGTSTVSGRAVYVIALTSSSSNTPIPTDQLSAITQRIFYIDQQSFLVLKMQFTHDADNGQANGLLTEMYFSNYKAVGGFLLPSKIDSYIESKLVSTANLSNFSINTGLQDSLFTITCGGSYAN